MNSRALMVWTKTEVRLAPRNLFLSACFLAFWQLLDSWFHRCGILMCMLRVEILPLHFSWWKWYIYFDKICKKLCELLLRDLQGRLQLVHNLMHFLSHKSNFHLTSCLRNSFLITYGLPWNWVEYFFKTLFLPKSNVSIIQTSKKEWNAGSNGRGHFADDDKLPNKSPT